MRDYSDENYDGFANGTNRKLVCSLLSTRTFHQWTNKTKLLLSLLVYRPVYFSVGFNGETVEYCSWEENEKKNFYTWKINC